LAVVGAGSEQVFETSLTSARDTDFLASCFPAPDQMLALVSGEPLAVAYDTQNQLVVQTRQPAGIHWMVAGEVRATLPLPGPTRRSVGHALFNRAASPMSPIACASCHPEGHEDGHVWSFQNVGKRRTQDVSGGVSMTKPFHWDGELEDMHSFMSEVFVNRMGGVQLPADRIDSLERWLDQVERIPASVAQDGDAVARGEALFFSDSAACGSCHSGGSLTNNTTVDVGTGKPFQVPSLVGVWSRAPYMHDGCAPTLRDRFVPGPCGGTELHGHTSQLSEEQIGDLVAYLETL
jgi:cytochrome c peroxidase